MSLQPFWRLGDLRASITSATSQLRTFFSSHAIKALSPDPNTRRVQMDRYNETRRLKRQTDPEWTKRHRAKVRRWDRNKYWPEEVRQTRLEYNRAFHRQRYAQDLTYKLRKLAHRCASSFAWFREHLPWKSHVPIIYKEKVEHSCEQCLVTRHGGLKLWWKQRQSVDGKQGGDSRQEQGQKDEKYLCHRCFITGPEAMPEGYEDVTTIAGIRARAKELGHSVEQ